MKNLSKSLPLIILILCICLGCSNVTKFLASKTCTADSVPNPTTSDDFLQRAGVHMEKGNYAEQFNQCAYQDLDQAVKLDDKNFIAYAGRGLMLMYDKRLDEAKADFDKALLLDPTYSPAYHYRSRLYKEKGDFDKAIADMDRTIELAPAESNHYVTRAGLYEQKGDYEKAVGDYSKAIGISADGAVYRDDGLKSYYELRAAAYRKLGRDDLARQDEETSKKTFLAEKSNEVGGEVRTGDSRTIAGGLLNDKAIEMPQPVYPPTARAVRAAGKVVVNIEVAPDGSVVSAKAESGHPLLKAAAALVARQAKFKPGPSPISGSLEYDFKAP
jgi:TonB family protein